MRGDELQGLREQRKSEDMDDLEINEEINKLIESQVILKNNNKEIKSLTKDNKKLTEQVKKLKSKVFDLQLKKDMSQSEPSIKEEKESDMIVLKRTMLMLKNKEQLTVEELAGRCLTPIKKMETYVEFLQKHNIIFGKRINGAQRYWI